MLSRVRNMMTKTVSYLQEEVILQHSLHRHHQQIPQGELPIVCSLGTLLQDESSFPKHKLGSSGSFSSSFSALHLFVAACATSGVRLGAHTPNRKLQQALNQDQDLDQGQDSDPDLDLVTSSFMLTSSFMRMSSLSLQSSSRVRMAVST